MTDTSSFSRRDLMTGGAAAVAVAALATPRAAQAAKKKTPVPFRYCLNTSTIMGQKIPLEKIIDMAAAAGYDSIEPWMSEFSAHTKSGGKLKDLKKRLDDHGMTVESAIGFAKWIVDDDDVRAKGLEDAKRDMGLVAELGGTRIAAPPAGATKVAGLDLYKAAERYRALLELGEKTGVTPMVEVWGFSKNLTRLSESMFVAIQSDHPDACLLPDIYHLYKGGSGFSALDLLSAKCIQVCHVNDYPDIPNEKITDADRVYPGDGVAPVEDILQGLADLGGTTVLSLELFNREYWKQDAALVVKTGLAKMKASTKGIVSAI